jgi:hypothetical protein
MLKLALLCTLAFFGLLLLLVLDVIAIVYVIEFFDLYPSVIYQKIKKDVANLKERLDKL